MDIPKSQGNFDYRPTPSPTELSQAAGGAVERYIEEADGYADVDTLSRVNRTVSTLAHFAPDTLSTRAFDAAAMWPLADSLRNPNRPTRYKAAGLGLYDYFLYSDDDRNTRSNGYVGTLLGDLPYIDAGADSFKARLDDAAYLALEGNTAITTDEWASLRVGANIPEIARVSRITNMESQLARAALTVDRIVHAGDDDQELLSNVLRVESFYAPLLEVYGLHAFDMMAQSNASKTRVVKSGNEQLLYHASETLDQAKQISTDEIMRQFLGRHPREYQFKTSEESLYDETIVFSSASLEELTDGRQSGELNTRFKTVGKYALKLLRNPRYDLDMRPADVFGMLAVLPDETQLGEFFADTIGHVLSSRSIELTTSASKLRPVFIQGSPEYVRRICEQVPSEILDRFVQTKIINDAPASDIYQVAKFTSVLEVDGQILPVEMQFQTKNDRKNARLGVPSHMNHNAGEGMSSIIPGSPNDLRGVFERKHDVDPNGELVNTLSIPHGEEFRRQFRGSVGLKG